MSTLLEFELSEGGKVLVKPVETSTKGPSPASRSTGIVAKASKTLEASLEELSKLTQTILLSIKKGTSNPKEIEVEFHVAFTGEADLMIISGNTEASFFVRMKWDRD